MRMSMITRNYCLISRGGKTGKTSTGHCRHGLKWAFWFTIYYMFMCRYQLMIVFTFDRSIGESEN
jgi:hypothetical protein